MLHRITPKLLLVALALGLSLWLCAYFINKASGDGSWQHVKSGIKLTYVSFLYLVAMFLNLMISTEYKNSRLLRFAWIALATNAGISIIRTGIESSLINKMLSIQMYGLIQHLAIVPANVCLLMGLIAMLVAFYRVGLDCKPERRDYLSILAIIVMGIGMIYFRQGLSEANSQYELGRYLQLSGLILLTLSGISSIILYRIAMKMGGGKLAVSLLFLTAYTLFRSALVLIFAIRRLEYPYIDIFTDTQPLFEILWQIVPIFAALSATYRLELTAYATSKLERHRSIKAATVI